MSECESLCLGCAEWDKGSCLVCSFKSSCLSSSLMAPFSALFLSLSWVFGTYRERDLLDFPTAFIPPHKPTHIPPHPHFRGDYLNGCSTCLLVFFLFMRKSIASASAWVCLSEIVHSAHVSAGDKKVGDKKGDISVQECERKTKTCLYTLWVQQHS